MPVFPNAKPSERKFQNGDAQYNTLKTTKHRITCPPDKVWEIDMAIINAGTSSTKNIRLYSPEGKLIITIVSASASTGPNSGPVSLGSASYSTRPFMMTEGDYVEFLFGTAQIAHTDFIYLRVWEYQRKDVLSN